MKKMVGALVLLVGIAHAEPSLPSAPASIHGVKLGLIDWSLAGSVLVSRALDWTSTEECLRRPYQQCHEGELPNALVHSKTGFAAFEFTTSALSVFCEYEMTKHGHRRLARIGQAIDSGVVAHTVERNYRILWKR
jgi:hypothetical protein